MRNNESMTFRAWLVVMIAALFFFYEFIQMNMFNSISNQVMQDFSINATQLGELSLYYFIANVVFLFPAGLILDRFSTRVIIALSMGLCVVATFLFSFVHVLALAKALRFLTGVGSSFCFLSCVRLASRWFSPKHMAMVTGFVVTMAMLGGVIAQTPLTLLVEKLSWRTSLQIDAVFGLALLLIIVAVVRDCPPGKNIAQMQQEKLETLGFWHSITQSILKLRNWFAGIYTCMMNLPISLLGGIWGILFLTHTYGLSREKASIVTSCLFFGTIIGAPFFGWLSDKIQLRKSPMFIGCLLSLLLVFLLMYQSSLSLPLLMTVFFLIGFTTSTQIISYPFVAESTTPMLTATSVSVVSLFVMGGQGIIQVVFGRLLDQSAHHRAGLMMKNGLPVYNAVDFHWAMFLFPLGILIAFISLFFLKETHCKSVGDIS